MGNKKFKLSDMIPNAWFYKLKDMGKNNRYSRNKKPHATSSSSSSLSNSSSLFSSSVSTNSNSSSIPPKIKQPQISQHRQSYYFTRDLSHENSPSLAIETKLPNSPVKSPKQRIGNRGNRESIEKFDSSICISSDSENSFSIMDFKSFNSNFDVFCPIKEIESPNSPIRGRVNRVPSEKQNSLNPISSDFGHSFHNSNIVSVDDSFDPFDPISKTKLPNSPNRSPKRRIRNRVCNKPNSQILFSPQSEISVFDANVQNLDTTFSGFYPISKTELPAIITKKKTGAKKEKKISAPRKQRSTPVFGHSVNSTGVRLRSNSPRIGKVNEICRKSFSSGGRRKLPESFAVEKSSSDPQKDFRESMVEMILHNKINGSKELEDLLACYLQLNCDEYHEMIIKVFKQIWFELNNVRA